MQYSTTIEPVFNYCKMQITLVTQNYANIITTKLLVQIPTGIHLNKKPLEPLVHFFTEQFNW